MPMQAGDVEATWADTSLLTYLTGSHRQTDIEGGAQSFIEWFRGYYQIGRENYPRLQKTG